MSIKDTRNTINPYLMDRLHAIRTVFASNKFANNLNYSKVEDVPTPFDGAMQPQPAKHWKDILNEDDGDDREGGGGGTMKGLRGKDAAHAMRTLRRGR